MIFVSRLDFMRNSPVETVFSVFVNGVPNGSLSFSIGLVNSTRAAGIVPTNAQMHSLVDCADLSICS